MSNKLLINESPLVFQPSLAVYMNYDGKRNGLQKAIIVQQVHFLSRYAASSRVMNGQRWVSYSFQDWEDEVFPFWKADTIRKLFSEMVEDGVLIEEYSNDDKFDRTKWHRVNYEFLDNLSASIRQRMPVVNKNKEKKEEDREIDNDSNPFIAWSYYIAEIDNITGEDLKYMLKDWNDHIAGLEDGHPDKSLEANYVVVEAVKETARKAKTKNTAYTQKIIDGWIADGYKIDKRAKSTAYSSPTQQEELGNLV